MKPTGNPSKKMKTNNQYLTSSQHAEAEQQSVEESIINQLKNRMLASGEWLRQVL